MKRLAGSARARSRAHYRANHPPLPAGDTRAGPFFRLPHSPQTLKSFITRLASFARARALHDRVIHVIVDLLAPITCMTHSSRSVSLRDQRVCDSANDPPLSPGDARAGQSDLTHYIY